MPRFEPIDHDPFAQQATAFMPVDHNPFENLARSMQTSPEERYFQSMSPVDQLKFERELANKRVYSPQEAEQNITNTLVDMAYSTPYLANAMSIRDAYEAKERARNAEPGSREQQQAEAESAASALSAFLPFGIGKPAAGSASRFGVFAGPTAKTADHAALTKAQEMKAQGASRADIWRETGWDLEKADQIPRFEIDDSSMTINVPKNQLSGEYGSYKKAIDHPELFEAYPPMQRSRITFDHRKSDSSIFMDKPSANAWDQKQYDTDIGVHGRVRSDRTQRKPRQIRDQTVHELQHNVQGREGFAPGSGPEEIWQAAMDSGNPITPEEAFDIYRRLAGEVEARNVQSRMTMNAAERRATPPWETQDVPDDQQIVRFR